MVARKLTSEKCGRVIHGRLYSGKLCITARDVCSTTALSDLSSERTPAVECAGASLYQANTVVENVTKSDTSMSNLESKSAYKFSAPNSANFKDATGVAFK